jgi:uncharacterized protein Usg
MLGNPGRVGSGDAKAGHTARQGHTMPHGRNRPILQPEDKMRLDSQLNGYRLTTAEILYHLPDHPGLLQTYVWQDLDLAPRFPVLHKFLDFWSRQLDGKLHSVRLANATLIAGRDWRHAEYLKFVH